MRQVYDAYWQTVKRSAKQELPLTYRLLQFGNTKEMADELGQLVLSKQKTATSSLIDYCHYQGSSVSQVGDCYVLLDWPGNVLGGIEVIKTATVPFGQIREEFALAEGDGSLSNWLTIHQAYYSEQLSSMGQELTAERLLHCEWFRLIE